MAALTLDHVVVAVRDLDAATADYAALLGLRPSWRGEHPAWGTANTLFRVDNVYLELLSLSASKAKDKRRSAELSRFLEAHGDGMYALALGTDDIKSTVRDVRDAGLEATDPADGEGADLATGQRRQWRNAFVEPKTTNGLRLFFIEHRSPRDALSRAEVTSDAASAVRRMDHAVVLSSDMEITRRLWDEQIGARLALDRTFPERNTRILFFRLGDITIEVSGGAEQTVEGMGKPDRLWGIAWGVDDVEAMCNRLRAAGIDVSGPRPGIKPGTLVATAKGPHTHGVATLLIQHLPQSFEDASRAAHGAAFDNAPQRRAFNATALAQVVVTTATLGDTTAKWQRTLGLHARPPEQGETAERVVRLDAGNGEIALTQSAEKGSPLAGVIAARGQGMASISIAVDDLDAAIADLRAKGVRVSHASGSGHASLRRSARVDAAGANGVVVDLVEGPRPP